MEMEITFPGGARVDANFGDFNIQTDQPVQGGGDGSAPTPFATFLASIGTCAGIYVLGFCQKRGLKTEGIRLTQSLRTDPETGVLAGVDVDIEVPSDFPANYRDALVRVAEQCAVKKAIQAQPRFDVRTVVAP